MQVVFARILGFCFGVRRAVEMALRELERNDKKKVYTLGPLIHNEIFLRRLCDKGLIIASEASILEIEDGSVVIIRAHGVAPDVLLKLKEKNCTIVDATCPRVLSSQKLVREKSEEGAAVIFTGDSNHGEVQGIAGFAKGPFFLIQDEDEALKIAQNAQEGASYLLLSQTTFSPQKFDIIKSCLLKQIPNIQVYNTICPATNERQAALRELCKEVDGVLVIGGKNSANTKRLFQTAKENSTHTAHIQSAQDIPDIFFNLEKVGITAGASTPDFIIEEVAKKLTAFNL